jgi:hypothetical protein
MIIYAAGDFVSRRAHVGLRSEKISDRSIWASDRSIGGPQRKSKKLEFFFF